MKKIAGWLGSLPLPAVFDFYLALFKDAGICYNLAKTGRMEIPDYLAPEPAAEYQRLKTEFNRRKDL